MQKKRLDALMVTQGIVESREKAKALVMAGDVIVGGQVVDRPSALVAADAKIQLRRSPLYASRGGLKLELGLRTFGVDIRGLVVMDVGASTGGFTDCLLKHGALRVYAIDVGYGQLAWRLREDPRVVVLDRTNVRYLAALPEQPDGAVVDVSFISLRLVLPNVVRLLKREAWVVALIKPQFEAGRGRVGKGGVVRDSSVHEEVLENVLKWASESELAVCGLTPSPIVGPAGNREFLAHFRKHDAPARSGECANAKSHRELISAALSAPLAGSLAAAAEVEGGGDEHHRLATGAD